MMAQYSLPFCVALAHHRDPRDPASFNLKIFNDPAIRALAQRVTITVADEAKHGHTIASTVTVTLKDGRALIRQRRQLQGHAGAAARPRRDAREIPAADQGLRRRRRWRGCSSGCRTSRANATSTGSRSTRRRRSPANRAPARKRARSETEEMTRQDRHAPAARRVRRHRRCGALPRRRRPGRVSDRDRLWARRRRHQRPGGGAALRRQGPAVVQSADRACVRSRRGASGSRCSTPRPKSSPRRSGRGR